MLRCPPVAAPTLQPPRPWATREDWAPFGEFTLGPDRVALLRDGAQAYPAMLDAIEAATSTICLETYILRDDLTGRRFLDALQRKAEAGVEVLLMFDSWGSTVTSGSLAALHDAKVKVLPFRPFKIAGSMGRIVVRAFRRNHRKALIVDGVIGFTGGLNISDDYASDADGGRGWRDTHVRIVGPSAQALERLFLNTWKRNRGPEPLLERFRRPRVAGCERIRIIGNDFSLDRKDIRKAYLEAFARAQQTIFLTHAYFLPPSKVLKAMVRASRRGVRVAVILAATTDVKMLLFAARGLYGRLLKNRVEVYEWQGRVLHAKTAVVDTTWSTVGSANLDSLSLRQNLEVNAVFQDRRLAAAVEQMFLQDLEQCQRITLETVRGYGWFQRLLGWLAYQARHWL